MLKVFIISSAVMMLLCITCFAALPAEVESIKGAQLYENTYGSQASLDEFVGEGPMIAEIRSGKLYMASRDSNGSGHFTTWYTTVDHPESFIIEFEFTPLKAKGLAILFTCAKGQNGEDIFDPSLATRNGQYNYYIRGDINNYGISYYRNNANQSDSVNLRKNAGFVMVKSVTPNPIPLPPACINNTYHCVWVKNGPLIRWYVDGARTLEWMDTSPYGSGKFGLRQMAATKAEYDNLRLYSVGPTKSIKLGSTGDPGPSSIRAWPNPFTTGVDITFSMQNANIKLQSAKFKIFNTQGKIMHSAICNLQSAINGCFRWDASNHPSGTYIIRVNTDNHAYTKTVTKH
jgi:hypothetical protein